MKISPIAKYLTENKVKVRQSRYKKNIIEFINQQGQILGTLKREHNIYSSEIDINLYKAQEDIPFLKQKIVIEKMQRYFLEKHCFMPVQIKISKFTNDYEHNIRKQDELTRGLASNLYIEQEKESDNLISERQYANLPADFPIFRINKPFKYDFKAHIYTPDKPIDTTKPMQRNK